MDSSQAARIVLPALIVLATSCAARQGAEPVLEPSTSSIIYATEWVGRLNAATGRYNSRYEQVKSHISEFASYPDALTDPDWSGVASVYREADKAGRSRAMVEALRAERQMESFIESQGKELGWRVGGQVSAALEKRGCKCVDEASRAASYAVRDSFRRQLGKRQRELNEAHRLLDREVQGPNKRNTRILEDQVDAITSASYFVYVEAIDLRMEIESLLEERRTVRRTLDRAVEAENAELEKGRSDQSRDSRGRAKALEERIEQLEGARTPLVPAVEAAQGVHGGMEEGTLTLRQRYQEAFDQLRHAAQDHPE